MRRRTVVLLVVGLIVAAGVVATVLVVNRTSDSSDPVAVSDAIRRFRDGPRSSGGVYVYDTTGSERISVLGGRTHAYPRLTTITVTAATPCGQLARWDALAIRWTEVHTCQGQQRDELRTITESRQFFGQTSAKALSCEPGSFARAAAAAGTTWHNRCTGEDEVLEATGTVLGTEQVAVGDAEVDTLHVRLEQRHSGARDGTSTIDEWHRPDDGLVVRRRVTVDVKVKTRVGTASYHEEYDLRLRSTEPRR